MGFIGQINRNKLLDNLGVPHKIPPDYELALKIVAVPDTLQRTLLHGRVTILAAHKRRHRILIQCKTCGGHIPAGRLFQHQESCREFAFTVDNPVTKLPMGHAYNYDQLNYLFGLSQGQLQLNGTFKEAFIHGVYTRNEWRILSESI